MVRKHSIYFLFFVLSFIAGRTASSSKSRLRASIRVCDRYLGEEGDDHPCKCDRNTIVCNGEGLKTALITPIRQRKNMVVKELIIKNNSLTILRQNEIMPDYRSTIERLTLSHNRISNIEDKAFHGFTNLSALDLTYNQLGHLRSEQFSYLSKLNTLSLEHNQLTKITGSVFRRLKYLKFLHLDHNPIKVLSDRTFVGLIDLEQLTLQNCQLNHLRNNWFKHMPRLRVLDLRDNSFEMIHPLQGLSNLQLLDISYNKFIYELSANTFDGLTNLTELIIDHMENLWTVDKCAFCGLKKLKVLDLFDNSELRMIDSEAFGGRDHFENIKVDTINFSGNNLSTLSQDLLPWAQLKSMQLGNNPWVCDCQLSWMTNVSLRFANVPPTCSKPAMVEHHTVQSLSESQMCSGAWTGAAENSAAGSSSSGSSSATSSEQEAGAAGGGGHHLLLSFSLVFTVALLMGIVGYLWYRRRHPAGTGAGNNCSSIFSGGRKNTTGLWSAITSAATAAAGNGTAGSSPSKHYSYSNLIDHEQSESTSIFEYKVKATPEEVADL